MAKVLSLAKDLRESLTDLSKLPKLTDIEPNNTQKQIEFVQEDGQNDGKDRKEQIYQSGVLRTNCIDCLHQKNVAQYGYGLAALGHQLFSLGLSEIPNVYPHNSMANARMDMYQDMGDALALQYGGSTTHNIVFLKRYGRETLTLGVEF